MLNNCFISLFSGAGGLDLGLEMAGWQGVYAADIDPIAVETLKANRDKPAGASRFLHNALIENADVRSLSGEAILAKIGAKKGDIPLLVGGPPCQSWSSAGRQRGFEDPRGRLFADFVRIARESGVKWLMFENVRGLLTARGPDGRPGSALELIRRQLLEAGFQTCVSLVNAANYGVGQRRIRLIVFGYRVGSEFTFPAPVFSKDGLAAPAWRPLKDVLHSVGAPTSEEIIRPSGLLAEQLRDLPAGSGVKSPGKQETTRPGGHWGYKQGAFIADPEKPARTVTANAQQDWVRDAELGLRRLSPRECAAIQSFPSDWVMCGKRVDQYRLIGNAVPPLLAYAIGKSLLAHVDSNDSNPVIGSDLAPLPQQLSSAIRYTEREERRNGESRRVSTTKNPRRAA